MTGPRPVLVGLCPGDGQAKNFVSPLYPFPSGSAGARLAGLCGLGRGAYLHHFDRVNLWPLPTASVPARRKLWWAAANLLGSGLLRDRHVICLGPAVWRGFGGREDFEYATVYLAREAVQLHAGSGSSVAPETLSVVPHPSGRNRVWNDPELATRCAKFLRGWVPDASPNLTSGAAGGRGSDDAPARPVSKERLT